MSTKITALPAASSVASTDLLVAVNDPAGADVTVKATASLFSPASFTSAQTVFNNSNSYSFAHGIGATPRFVRAVMVSQIPQDFYSIGDEVDIRTVFNSAFSNPQFSVSANSTNVVVSDIDPVPASFGNQIMARKTGGSSTAPDFTQWKLKVYASL